ncbi:MCE family protein [Amycolatopsis silviterrae]|uniref:MCE family protein n=1 Tax=Amycolatopsis silviterrae TaxID=1656914 RepID=A0ABW5HLC6_9PSEU
MTRRSLSVLAVGTCLAVTGCQVGGVNSVVLPGGVGTGDSGYPVRIEFASAANLVANSEVKVNDVTVGTVTAIGLEGWHAQVTVSLRRDVQLPANTVARIGQKSLLGAEYVELAPPTGELPVGRLRGGDVITLAHSDRYPETEELLASLSTLLNGGGLQQVQTIAREVNNALGGNEQATRDLLANLNTFVGRLSEQRQQITRAISAVDKLGAALSAQREQIGTAIDKIGPGLSVLNQQRGNLTEAMGALDNLGVVGTRVVNSSKDALLTDLRDLQPTLAKLVEAGDSLPKSLDLLGTFLFPIKAVPNAVKGDNLNASITVDASLPALATGLFPGLPVESALQQLATALQATDPVTGPVTAAVNGVGKSVAVGGQSGGLVTPQKPAPAPTSAPAAPSSPPASTPTSPPAANGGLLGFLLGGG